MNPRHVSSLRWSAALMAGLLSVSVITRAQTAPKPAADEAILLNPFDVTESTTKGYMATNTISGTAMNTPLRDVPMAINVITAEFLADRPGGPRYRARLRFQLVDHPDLPASPSANGGSFCRFAASAIATCSSMA